MTTTLDPFMWATPTTAAGVTPRGQPWQVILTSLPSGGVNARIIFPSGEVETSHHDSHEDAAKAAEWALARAGAVQKPIDLMLQELTM